MMKVKVPFKINKNIILYLYTFLLFCLNFVRIFDNAFWGDEGFTIRLAKMEITEMVAKTANDVHPPLHYIFTKGLYLLFGDQGFTYHLSGLIPYGILLVLACTIIKNSFGRIPAFVLVTMQSLMKSAVTNNVEARMYSLGALFVFGAYIFFYNIIKKNREKHWIGFCIFSLGAAYTHYYALIFVAFFYLMLLFLSIKKKELRKGTAIAYIVTIVAYLPWLGILIQTFGRTSNDWWLGTIPSVKACLNYLFDYKWLLIVFIIVVAYFLLSQSGILQKRKIEISFSDEAIWIISGIVSIIGTVFIGLALSKIVRPLFLPRYMFSISAVTYFILGYCISWLKWKRAGAILIISGILLCNVPEYVHCLQDDIHLNNSTTNFLNEVNPSVEATIYSNDVHLAWTLLEYYYPENNRSYAEDVSKVVEDAENQELWLFWTQELDWQMEQSICNQGYTVNKQYEGVFANDINYYAYVLENQRSEE